MNGTLTIASAQWFARPPDQRFLTLESLLESVDARKLTAKEKVLEARLSAKAVQATEPVFKTVVGENGEKIDTMVSPGRVFLQSTNGELNFNHFSFGQLAARVGAPAGYLRQLPAPLAVQNVQYGMLTAHASRNNGDDRFKLFMTPPNGQAGVVRAFNGVGYGRIYDADVVRAVIEMNARMGGVWQVPLEAYGGVNSAMATTLYASDHDCFLFLTNENRQIELGNGREARKGIIIANSEVGDGALDLWSFAYDMVCQNRMIWGPRHVKQFSMRHSTFAPERFLREVVPALTAYADAGVGKLEALVQAAQKQVIAPTKQEVLEFLRNRGFTKMAATASIDLAERGVDSAGIDIGSNGDPTTVWGVLQGLTGYARGIAEADTRTDFETKAGRLLDVVNLN